MLRESAEAWMLRESAEAWMLRESAEAWMLRESAEALIQRGSAVIVRIVCGIAAGMTRDVNAADMTLVVIVEIIPV
jgi:hypothetical protein